MTPAGLARLRADEGCRLKPSCDTRGNLSIGFGRCLDTQGISAAEAAALFANDVAEIDPLAGEG